MPPRRMRIQKQETVDRGVSDIVPQTCYDNYAYITGMIYVGWISKQFRMTIYHTTGYRRGIVYGLNINIFFIDFEIVVNLSLHRYTMYSVLKYVYRHYVGR